MTKRALPKARKSDHKTPKYGEKQTRETKVEPTALGQQHPTLLRGTTVELRSGYGFNDAVILL